MSAVFFIFCTISVVLLCFNAPQSLLPAMLKGTEKSLTLTLSLVSVYSVWTGVFKLTELSGVTDSFSKTLKKPIKLLFGKTNKQSENLIALNLSANILGLGGIATPLGIRACNLLCKSGNERAADLLFILAATSVQILPTSVIALAVEYGAKNASSTILPCFLSTLSSTLSGIFIFKASNKFSLKSYCGKLHSTTKKA